jgi:hypothetical protein
VGLILDLAVVALAAVVIGSLALLAWTLGVSGVRSVRQGLEAVVAARRSLARTESRLVASANRAAPAVEHLARRTAPQPTQPDPAPGEQPDA